MIIALAGPIGSGKSTLSRALAVRLNARSLAFGDYIRAQASAEGLGSASRSALQDLGQRLVASDPAAFVENALSWAGHKGGGHFIVDGIRHEAVWRELADFSCRTNENARLVFLEIPEHERQRRLRARGLQVDEIKAFDDHVSERDLRRYLYEAADLHVDGLQAPTDLAETVVRSLKAA